MDRNSLIYRNLQRFANDHKCVLQDEGVVGFGRPCVGFVRGNNYLYYAPYTYDLNAEHGIRIVWIDGRLRPPDTVPDAYHKDDCLCVLALGDWPDYDEALRQLNLWIEHLKAQGEIVVEPFSTGHTDAVGIILHGVRNWGIRFADTEVKE